MCLLLGFKVDVVVAIYIFTVFVMFIYSDVMAAKMFRLCSEILFENVPVKTRRTETIIRVRRNLVCTTTTIKVSCFFDSITWYTC